MSRINEKLNVIANTYSDWFAVNGHDKPTLSERYGFAGQLLGRLNAAGFDVHSSQVGFTKTEDDLAAVQRTPRP